MRATPLLGVVLVAAFMGAAVASISAEPQKPVVVPQKPATTTKAPEKGMATAPVQKPVAGQKPAAQKQEKAATTTGSQGARAGLGQFDTLSPLRPPINNPAETNIPAGRRLLADPQKPMVVPQKPATTTKAPEKGMATAPVQKPVAGQKPAAQKQEKAATTTGSQGARAGLGQFDTLSPLRPPINNPAETNIPAGRKLLADPQKPMVVPQKPATTTKAPEKGMATAPVQKPVAGQKPAAQKQEKAATTTGSQGARAGLGQFDTLSPLRPPINNPAETNIPAGRRLLADPQKPMVAPQKPATTTKAPEKGMATAPVQKPVAGQKPAAQKQEKAATTTGSQGARAGLGQFDTLSPLRPPINNPAETNIPAGRRLLADPQKPMVVPQKPATTTKAPEKGMATAPVQKPVAGQKPAAQKQEKAATTTGSQGARAGLGQFDTLSPLRPPINNPAETNIPAGRRLLADPQKPMVVPQKPATTTKAPEKGMATAPVQKPVAGQKPAAQKQEKAATTTGSQGARAGLGQFDTLSPLRPPINNPAETNIPAGRRLLAAPQKPVLPSGQKPATPAQKATTSAQPQQGRTAAAPVKSAQATAPPGQGAKSGIGQFDFDVPLNLDSISSSNIVPATGSKVAGKKLLADPQKPVVVPQKPATTTKAPEKGAAATTKAATPSQQATTTKKVEKVLNAQGARSGLGDFGSGVPTTPNLGPSTSASLGRRLLADPQKPAVAPTGQKPATPAKAPEKGRTTTTPVQQKPAAQKPAGQEKAASTSTTTGSDAARSGLGKFQTLSPLKPPLNNQALDQYAGRR